MSGFYWEEDDADEIMELLGFDIGLERDDHLDVHVVSEHLAEFKKCSDALMQSQKDYAALLARAEAAESELSQVKSSGIEAMRRAEAAEKERDELASSIHAAMERYSSHEKKQSINQLVADVAYLKRLSKEHYAESKRLREALERMCNNALELGYCDMADCCNCKTTAALNGDSDD